MPWGGGAFNRFYGATGWTDDKLASTFIVSSRHDTHDQDLADGINACITRDNQAKPTADFAANATNSFNLGTSSVSWKQLFLGTIKAAIWDDATSILGYIGRTSAESAASVTPVSFFYPEGNAFRYMSAAQITSVIARDLSQDVTTPINNAFKLKGVNVYLPCGAYSIRTNLAVPVCASITFAQGFNNATTNSAQLVAFAGVTKCLSLSGSCTTYIFGLHIVGNATNSAIGLIIGDGSACSNIKLDNPIVTGFTGTGAVGTVLDQVVTLDLVNPYLYGNTVNLTTGTTPSFPTTVKLWGGAIRTATLQGAIIKSANGFAFHGTVVESNTQQGALVQVAAGCTVVGLLMDLRTHFENNWFGHVDTGTKVFSLELDGTLGQLQAELSDTLFTQGSILSDRKSIKLTSTSLSLKDICCFYGFAFEITCVGSANFVQVLSDIYDRCLRVISNPSASIITTPPYLPVFDNADGTSVVPLVNTVKQLTYSASITINAAQGDYQYVIANNGTAFTFNAPTKPVSGSPLTVRIFNTSGGALGAVTWNAIFKLAAWTSPATGFNRAISFRYDGTNWTETSRNTVDVPN